MRLLSIIVFTVVLISNTFGQTTPTTQVKTIDDLVALRIPTINNRLSALVTGRVTENDGGGGLFFYDGASAVTTNLGTVFKPAASAGRWVRQYSGDLNLLWFGADPTGALSAHTSLTNAIGVISGGGKVFMPSGTYLIDKPITISNNNIWLYGAGQRETILDGNTSPIGASPLLLVDNGTDGIAGFTIKDLTINMDSTTPSGIELVGARPFLIDNILINGDIGLANQCILIGNRAGGYSAFSTIQNSFFTTAQYGIVMTNAVSDFSIVNNSFVNGVNPNNAAIVIGSTVTGQGVISGNELEGWTYALHMFNGGGVKFVNNRTETIATSVVRWESTAEKNWAFGNSFDGSSPPTTPFDDQTVGKNNVYFGPLADLTAISRNGTFSNIIAGANLTVTNTATLGTLSGLLLGSSGVVSANTGTGSYIPMWIAGGVTGLQNSNLADDGGAVGYKTATPSSLTDTTISGTRYGIVVNGGAGGGVFEVAKQGIVGGFFLEDSGNNIYLAARTNASSFNIVTYGSIPIKFKITNVEQWSIDTSGNLVGTLAGKGIKIKEGSNARMGTATLVGGTIAVANTSVTANTRVFISRSTTGGTEGTLSTTQIASTSFTVNSTSGTDTSTVNWLLIEPSP